MSLNRARNPEHQHTKPQLMFSKPASNKTNLYVRTEKTLLAFRENE